MRRRRRFPMTASHDHMRPAAVLLWHLRPPASAPRHLQAAPAPPVPRGSSRQSYFSEILAAITDYRITRIRTCFAGLIFLGEVSLVLKFTHRSKDLSHVKRGPPTQGSSWGTQKTFLTDFPENVGDSRQMLIKISQWLQKRASDALTPRRAFCGIGN